LIGAQELFAPFKEFPWFKDASIGEITRVELPSPHHLYWPDLDVDLAVESADEGASAHRHEAIHPAAPSGLKHYKKGRKARSCSIVTMIRMAATSEVIQELYGRCGRRRSG
jgi:Protein of unknown function (DUF2442)